LDKWFNQEILNNAIVYVDKEISESTMKNLKAAFRKDTKVKWNIRQPYFTLSNEAARHKLLDVVGDLALIEKIR
jgi:UDP-3-O-[3-hydroxymyristoyl] N-acetylglucosamine deacetylase/3-hydroxyacyl-[acyl-carrier-protein] dehydratase